MDEVGFLLMPLCCGCWLLPLVALGIVYGVGQSILYAWSNRGIERGGMYCAQCRFDLRGATSEQCPECGASLLEPARPGLRCGGVRVHNVDPPMLLGWRLLSYLLGGFAPAVAVVLIAGALLPVNYTRSIWVELDAPLLAQFNPVTFTVDMKRTWLGSEVFDELYCWEAGYDRVQPFNNATRPDSAHAEQVWQGLVSQRGDTIPLAVGQAMRDEFVAVLLAACRADRAAARAELNQFRMSWGSETYLAYHPLYIILSLFLVGGAMAGLIWAAIRHNRADLKAHQESVERVLTRYRKRVEATRRQMGG